MPELALHHLRAAGGQLFHPAAFSLRSRGVWRHLLARGTLHSQKVSAALDKPLVKGPLILDFLSNQLSGITCFCSPSHVVEGLKQVMLSKGHWDPLDKSFLSGTLGFPPVNNKVGSGTGSQVLFTVKLLGFCVCAGKADGRDGRKVSYFFSGSVQGWEQKCIESRE